MLKNGNLNSIVIKKEHVIKPFISSAVAACEAGEREKQLQSEKNLEQDTKLVLSLLLAEENGRAINYILLKLNNLLKDIDYIINIKNKLIKIFKVRNINNLGASRFAASAAAATQPEQKKPSQIAASYTAKQSSFAPKGRGQQSGIAVATTQDSASLANQGQLEKSNKSTVNPLNNNLSSDA